MSIVNLLENYLKDEEEQIENINNNEDSESDKENHSFTLFNPNKKTRPKGRPKGTKRIKAYHEKEASVTNRQYRCDHYGDMGHNKRNCNNGNV